MRRPLYTFRGKFNFTFKLLFFSRYQKSIVFSTYKREYIQHIMENIIINNLDIQVNILPAEPESVVVIKKSKKNLWNLKQIRDDKDFKCKSCDKSYDAEKQLKRHLCMLKFVCKICPEKVGFGFLTV